jgi:uncharacterized phiE125 gp8 family phage protein
VYSLQLTLGPTEEPVSLDEAKAHCRVDLDDDDLLIEDLIIAARESLELETARSFLTTQWTMGIDDFPRCGQTILLPRSPVQEVTSIHYTDVDGVEQTLSTDVYGVDVSSEPGVIYLKPSQSWPSIYGVPRPIQIAFIAGWEDVLYVPAGIKSAIKLLVAHWYEAREAAAEKAMTEIPLGVQRLMWLHRVPQVA